MRRLSSYRVSSVCGISLMIDALSYLPHINACLNSASAVLLFSGYLFIRRHNIKAHRNCQVSAFVLSTIFLISYLIYHFNHGTTRFTGQGIVRSIYFTIPVSYTHLRAHETPEHLVCRLLLE